MIYPTNFEQKIGFDAVRSLLCEECQSALGQERVEMMCFTADFAVVERWLAEATEFVGILQHEDGFPDGNFFDVRGALRRIRLEGMYLDEQELFDLRRSLEATDGIVRFLRAEGDEKPRFPHLAALTDEVVTFPIIIRRIDGIINKYGKIKDDASVELLRIRREMARTTAGISHSLNAILRASQAEGLVEKDVAPTLRDGRLVIPVAPAMKRKIRGIVHDESATGKTVYIEPTEVVEANNRIRELEGEERREMIRILTAFAAEIRPSLDEMLGSFEFLAEVDFIRAKGRLALKIGGVMPNLSKHEVIDWMGAVHPLLYLSLKKQEKKVVPLDISLHRSQRILIISGPNAGGKSVCLKTVGLLQYMLQCGLLIPVDERSHAGLFESIFIDIGDEQSIEDDLSTYSSHLLNMKHMMRHCNGHSLILIDEFGSGSVPHIGGALA